MEIIKFIQTYWSDITLILSVIFVILRALFTNNLEYLKADIFMLITDAEDIYGAKAGRMKLSYVEKIIESVLIKAKESWEKPQGEAY